MKILCKREEWLALDETVKRFADAVWIEPDQNGYRSRQPLDWTTAFGEMGLLTEYITIALMDRTRASPLMVPVADPDRGTVRAAAEWTFSDKSAEVAFNLAEAWSLQRDLGQCQQCGNVFIPDRNRTARFCSANCRVAAHRAKKED